LRRRSASPLYAACAIGRVARDEVKGRIWRYLSALLLALIVMALFLWLSIGFL
jgi:TRAP-type C4-dicarboxylate transport system permease large subunit